VTLDDERATLVAEHFKRVDEVRACGVTRADLPENADTRARVAAEAEAARKHAEFEAKSREMLDAIAAREVSR
jgi:hypothetical protein